MRRSTVTATSRDVILDAAEHLFAARGYAGVSISDVCRVSGFPVGSVYHHFGDKAGLLGAVVRRGSLRFFGSLPHEIPTDREPRARLEAYFTRAADLITEHFALFRLQVLLPMQDHADPDVVALQHDIDERTSCLLVDLIEPVARDRGVPDPRALATELAEQTMIFTMGLVVTRVRTDDVDMHIGLRRVLRLVLLAVDAEATGVPRPVTGDRLP